jgi:hypothetical protein
MSFSEYVSATSLILKTSGFASCLSTFDCLGRALAMDAAYRDLDAAKQLLLSTQRQQLNAPHTDAAERAIKHIDSAEDFLRNFTVSPDTVEFQ